MESRECVATRSRRGDLKFIFLKIFKFNLKIWSCHYSLLWENYRKIKKIKMSTNQIQDSESVTCGTVLTSHNTRSKTVPLIK